MDKIAPDELFVVITNGGMIVITSPSLPFAHKAADGHDDWTVFVYTRKSLDTKEE